MAWSWHGDGMVAVRSWRGGSTVGARSGRRPGPKGPSAAVLARGRSRVERIGEEQFRTGSVGSHGFPSDTIGVRRVRSGTIRADRGPTRTIGSGRARVDEGRKRRKTPAGNAGFRRCEVRWRCPRPAARRAQLLRTRSRRCIIVMQRLGAGLVFGHRSCGRQTAVLLKQGDGPG
jgi:hypothetical protein